MPALRNLGPVQSHIRSEGTGGSSFRIWYMVDAEQVGRMEELLSPQKMSGENIVVVNIHVR